MHYALLRAPHANTRYDAELDKLIKCEFAIIAQKLGIGLSLAAEKFGSLELQCFEAQLDDYSLRALARISSVLAIFEVHDGLLKPIEQSTQPQFAKDMPSILKYKGKTNENFTRMMINLAVFTSDFNFERRLSLLDPMCGKGTTLFCSFGYGYNSFGIEKDTKEINEAVNFAKTYFKHERIKHSYDRSSMTLTKSSANKHSFVTAMTAEQYKNGHTLSMDMVAADSMFADKICSKKRFELLVTDLPYGIQHGTVQSKKGSDTLKFLESALPTWSESMKEGGAIVMSFNSYTIKRDDLRSVLADAGLEVKTGFLYDGFEHWVEQAVNRDVAVAVKK